jgi:hypothetical protein
MFDVVAELETPVVEFNPVAPFKGYKPDPTEELQPSNVHDPDDKS